MFKFQDPDKSEFELKVMYSGIEYYNLIPTPKIVHSQANVIFRLNDSFKEGYDYEEKTEYTFQVEEFWNAIKKYSMIFMYSMIKESIIYIIYIITYLFFIPNISIFSEMLLSDKWVKYFN